MKSIPYFLGVGPGKAGTSWLDGILRLSNEVQLPQNIKETYYFSENYDKEEDWYSSQYLADGRGRGEICNRYIFSEPAIERAVSHNANVKFIFFYREPVSRLISCYLFAKKQGEKVGSLSEFSKDKLDEFDNNLLFSRLLRHSPKKNIHVFRFEGLATDPQKEITRVCDFLGIQTIEIDAKHKKPVNPARFPRVRILGYLGRRLALILRKTGMYSLLTFLKNSKLIDRLLYANVQKSDKNDLIEEARHVLRNVDCSFRY